MCNAPTLRTTKRPPNKLEGEFQVPPIFRCCCKKTLCKIVEIVTSKLRWYFGIMHAFSKFYDVGRSSKLPLQPMSSKVFMQDPSSPIHSIDFKNNWGHSRLGYYFWVSNGLRIILDNFTYLVCLDLYCGAYFGSYLHFILHIEYTDKVNLEE